MSDTDRRQPRRCNQARYFMRANMGLLHAGGGGHELMLLLLICSWASAIAVKNHPKPCPLQPAVSKSLLCSLHSWYDKVKIMLKEIQSCQYAACMNPTAGGSRPWWRMQG